MATLLLQAAGAFLGGSFGTVGAAIGTAAGALLGNAIDTALLTPTRSIEGSRLNSHQPFTADEGAPIPRLYGTARLSSTMIWLTRYEESSTTTREGGKGGFGGGTKVTRYSYFANVAFAICEGQVAGLKRVWIDGREVSLHNIEHRFYKGGEDQLPDPLIEAKQGAGNAPAYRGICYIVFERFALENYGNRIPQFQFEIMRPIGAVERQTKAITIIPGATEYGYSPSPVSQLKAGIANQYINRAVFFAQSDWSASMDELQALCPHLEHVALVVPWFGSDLRAGECRIEPKTVAQNLSMSQPWRVAGLRRNQVKTVSYHQGGAAYGGTPSDATIIAAIADLKKRGLKVTFYPFIMMDIAQDNDLPSPYGDARQPAYPWRGRITCNPAPNRANSADKTAVATHQVTQFLGNGNDWRYRRFIAHYANLCMSAGGVDSFLIGSELRGLSHIRGPNHSFPFVSGLIAIAAEARGILGNQTQITYAADWSEYFGYHPQDGSGNVYFHLDPLWSNTNINAVGIDNYMPISDLRSPSRFGFEERDMVAYGEGYDWYYASSLDRETGQRTPITDGAYGKPWVFRYKDLINWWRQPHYERRNGVEAASPTSWQPESKPFWFTELGCPAVDRGGNQPNVFPDVKSSENAMPYGSNGRSDPASQTQFLRAHFTHWQTENPLSTVYGGKMIDMDRCYLWCWDARPYPAFPARTDLWSDGLNYSAGHWLNGRFGSVMLDELIERLCTEYGLNAPDTSKVSGSIMGLVVAGPAQLRAVMEPLLQLFAIAPIEKGGVLQFAPRTNILGGSRIIEHVVDAHNGVVSEYTRTTDPSPINEVLLNFSDPMNDYAPAIVRSLQASDRTIRQQKYSLPIAIDKKQAQYLVDDWLARQEQQSQQITFKLPINDNILQIGDQIAVKAGDFLQDYEVVHVEFSDTQQVVAIASEAIAVTVDTAKTPLSSPLRGPYTSGILPIILNLPMLPSKSDVDESLLVGASMSPWRQIGFAPQNQTDNFGGILECAATIGVLQKPLQATQVLSRIQHDTEIVVELYQGAFESIDRISFLNGRNAIAIGDMSYGWEIIQFEHAEEIAPDIWRLKSLLRGQLGSEDIAFQGHDVSAQCVLIDSCLRPLGAVAGDENDAAEWIFFPAGEALDQDELTRLTYSGVPRASIALAPVHVRYKHINQTHCFNWIRRGRIDADRWDQLDIPLGELSEQYRVSIQTNNGEELLTKMVSETQWILNDAELRILEDVTSDPLIFSVSQIGQSLDAVLSASLNFTINA